MKIGYTRLLIIGLGVAILYLQYPLWFQQGGLVDMWRLHHAYDQALASNGELKARNLALLTEVQHLQNNPDIIEEKARQDLGMVKRNETYYQIVQGST